MTRAFKAGVALGQAIIEMVHLMYQTQTATRFYEGLFTALDGEFERRNIPGECAKGGEHEWGIDGQHQNEFCKKCFITKPEL